MDRANDRLVPRDFTLTEETALEEERSRRLSRISSNLASGDPDIFRTHSRRASMDTRRSATANTHASGSGGAAGVGPGSLDRSIPPIPENQLEPRPVTPPQQIRSSLEKRTVSTSPRSLSFSLPTKPNVERSPVAGKASLPPGALTPVKESALSRNPSRADSAPETPDKADQA